MCDAGAIIVITAVPARSMDKYGDRGYRYTLLEAGHVAQNINLAGAALAVGTLNLGGFFDHDLAALLSIERDEESPVHGIVAGVPEELERHDLRMTGE